MLIKKTGVKRSPLNQFDLLGDDEVGLAKAFAYVLGREPDALYRFLHQIGIPTKHTPANFLATMIITERKREAGRTDIEIRQAGKFHVIIECKVRSNRLQRQRTQYLRSFQDDPKKVLCFITQKSDFRKQVFEGVDNQDLGWMDVVGLYDHRKFQRMQLVRDFVSFAVKGFRMRDQREILVQDLGIPVEVRRFVEYHVYRRGAVFGSPLYFAPYFTRKAHRQEGEGISCLSKVLGILTLAPEDIDTFQDDLNRFTNSAEVVKRWIDGVKLGKSRDTAQTYFFLGEPLKLSRILKKDTGRKKGSGKEWIAAMIPKNRCVTFHEFARRLMVPE